MVGSWKRTRPTSPSDSCFASDPKRFSDRCLQVRMAPRQDLGSRNHTAYFDSCCQEGSDSLLERPEESWSAWTREHCRRKPSASGSQAGYSVAGSTRSKRSWQAPLAVPMVHTYRHRIARCWELRRRAEVSCCTPGVPLAVATPHWNFPQRERSSGAPTCRRSFEERSVSDSCSLAFLSERARCPGPGEFEVPGFVGQACFDRKRMAHHSSVGAIGWSHRRPWCIHSKSPQHLGSAPRQPSFHTVRRQGVRRHSGHCHKEFRPGEQPHSGHTLRSRVPTVAPSPSDLPHC